MAGKTIFSFSSGILAKLLPTSTLSKRDQLILGYALVAADMIDPKDDKDTAKTDFLEFLDTLGIKKINAKKVGKFKNFLIEAFRHESVDSSQMTDQQKREAMSMVNFQTVELAHKFADFEGTLLDTLYVNIVFKGKTKVELPYTMYMMTFGEHVLFRVSDEEESYASLMHRAIQHVSSGDKYDDMVKEYYEKLEPMPEGENK